MICVGFDAADADGYTRGAKKRLEVLVPALESAVRQHRRLCQARTDFPRLIDRLATPVAFLGPEREDEHCNRPLRTLLATEPEAKKLRSAIRSVVPPVGDDIPAGGSVSTIVDCAGGRYRLRLGRPPRSVGRGWLVLVDRLSLYPSPATLEASWGLTAREAEVALLLAEGLSNRDLAEALTISPHTARHHVQSVLHKLDVSSRSAVAHVLLRGERGA
jgi:DNA-binding CsgD family transcriptional regulator